MEMIMSLPAHIDAEKFVSVTMDVIKGRYGKDGYYSGVMPFVSALIRPSDLSMEYARGFSGKNGLRYYEIDAEELDPVIIATLEELGEMVGMDYSFVMPNRIVNRDWWRPFGEFQEGYCESYELEMARESYERTLRLLNGQKKFA